MLFAGLSNLTKRSKAAKVNLRPRVYYFRRWKVLLVLAFLCVVFVLSLWLLGRDHSYRIGHVQTDFKYHSDNLSLAKAEEHIIYVENTKVGNSVEGHAFYNFIQVKFCPACFSQLNCSSNVFNEIHIEEAAFKASSNQTSIWFNAKYRETKNIQVGYIEQPEWNKFEMSICKNVTSSISAEQCNVSKAIREGFLSNTHFIEDVNQLANLHEIVHKNKSEMPLLICATNKMVQQVKLSFDDDGDNKLNSDEQLTMLTSLIMNPGYALMKFKMKGKLNVPIPNIFGACGRVIARESDWTSLIDQLNEPFAVRAGIALQVIQAVEDLQEEDPQWYFLNTDFSYESLMRNKDGEIVLVNLQDVAIIDKSLFPKRQTLSMLDPDGEICNDSCFYKFSFDMLHSKSISRNVCPNVSKYGQLMQALVCKEVLSDLDEHKKIGFFKATEAREKDGLLHSVPEQDKDAIEDLLRECVQETNVGGRKQAVEELREILEKYLNYEDQEDKASKNDENENK